MYVRKYIYACMYVSIYVCVYVCMYLFSVSDGEVGHVEIVTSLLRVAMDTDISILHLKVCELI